MKIVKTKHVPEFYLFVQLVSTLHTAPHSSKYYPLPVLITRKQRQHFHISVVPFLGCILGMDYRWAALMTLACFHSAHSWRQTRLVAAETDYERVIYTRIPPFFSSFARKCSCWLLEQCEASVVCCPCSKVSATHWDIQF